MTNTFHFKSHFKTYFSVLSERRNKGGKEHCSWTLVTFLRVLWSEPQNEMRKRFQSVPLQCAGAQEMV